MAYKKRVYKKRGYLHHLQPIGELLERGEIGIVDICHDSNCASLREGASCHECDCYPDIMIGKKIYVRNGNPVGVLKP